MTTNALCTLDEARAKIASGGRLLLAGDESLLRQLPRGTWIGGASSTSRTLRASRSGVNGLGRNGIPCMPRLRGRMAASAWPDMSSNFVSGWTWSRRSASAGPLTPGMITSLTSGVRFLQKPYRAEALVDAVR